MDPAAGLVLDRERTPGTLGAVVYANASKALVSEGEWVLLVRSVAAGDQGALHALYERTHRAVFTYVMRITVNRETAEEVTLDVFHDVWRHASRYQEADGTVLGWIMIQARCRAIDRLRFDQRKKRVQPESGVFLRIDVCRSGGAVESASRNDKNANPLRIAQAPRRAGRGRAEAMSSTL